MSVEMSEFEYEINRLSGLLDMAEGDMQRLAKTLIPCEVCSRKNCCIIEYKCKNENYCDFIWRGAE